MNREARALTVRIKRSAAEAYEFLSLPENFPKWASGLGASLRRNGDDWVVETPEGPATVRFSERNAYGVLDHQVRLPRGGTVYMPLRVIANGLGCDLVLTLFRRPEMTEAQFAADAEWVMRDLEAAKRLLERSG
jgi:hypothetical protein